MGDLAVVLLLLTVFSRTVAFAQNFSLISGRDRVVSLNGLWRFHTGDDPTWANPDFDDSQWPLIRSDRSWTEQGYPAFTGFAWYRFKVEVPDDGKPVGLLVDETVNGYKVFANGRLLGSGGSAEPTWDPVFESYPTVYPIPLGAKGPQTIVIALRVWSYRPIASWLGAGPIVGGCRFGDPNPLAYQATLIMSDRTTNFVNEYAFALFAALVGFAVLSLFSYRPADKEYLWFAVLLLAECADGVVHLCLNLKGMPFLTWRFCSSVFVALALIASLEFFAIIGNRRKSAAWWFALGAAAASTLTTALICFQWTSIGVAYTVLGACLLPAYLWIIVNLLVGTFKRDVSARLLLAPVLFLYGLRLLDLIGHIGWQITGSASVPAFDFPIMTFPFRTLLVDVAGYLFMLALLIFLVSRFVLARQREENLSSEFEAARTIQSLLVPTSAPTIAGFRVESVYLPAQEVGGDFFQVLPDDDGSLLLVLGDVSGKGLRAAMTVSTAIGALRGCTTRKPSEVLTYLGRVLYGQVNGFVTCCAAFLTPDGKLTIANAGHLPPYCNGGEMDVVCGLPLGIVREDKYTESNFTLSPNEQVTFVSDGIVEARDKSGALFGFERTRVISLKAAKEIAQAATEFGQEDDITVLTLSYVGVPTSA